MTGNVVTWPQVTGSDPEVTSFDRKSPGSGCRRPKTGYTVHFTYKAVVRTRRQSRDWKWHHLTSGDRKWPGSDVIWTEVTWKCCRRPKTGVYCTFHYLQGLARRRRKSTDRNGRHVPSGDRKWPGSDVIWPEITWKWL